MRRTQLYLDDDLWNALRARARNEGTTVSDLVRQVSAISAAWRSAEAMQALAGIRKDHSDPSDSTRYVRRLRHGRRLENR